MENQVERTSFNRPKWELRPKSQPHPAKRWCHTATTHGTHLYLMGGRLAQSAKTKEYAYRIHCQTFQCEPIHLSDNPLMRESHSCALINDSMYVLFGINKASKVLNDCLHLKISDNSLVWQRKNQDKEIEGRQSHMSVILEDRYILIYGGIDGDEKLIEDFYLYDLVAQNWRKIDRVEGEIQGKVGGTLINIKNQIYLFGGQINDQNQYSNQIYKIHIHQYKHTDQPNQTSIQITKLNVTGSKPLPRSQFASTVYKDRYLIVLGGQGPGKDKSQPAKLLNDIWAFDTQKMTWEQILPQNQHLFKPRSSFTANIHKDTLITFGGLVSLKDFKSSDEIFILHLNSQVERKPICNMCRSSYKPIPKQDTQIQKSKAVQNINSFQTGLSTVMAISQTIQNPFVGIATLLHSFDPFQIQKCSIVCSEVKLNINLKDIKISDFQWRHILRSYEFIPLIHQHDERIKKSLSRQIHWNFVNYLSYNLKNVCFRLGNQLLISWINQKQELEISLMNKFGIYHTKNISSQNSFKTQTSLIFQFMKEYDIQPSSLLQNRMTIFVTSLKQLPQKNYQREIHFDPDIQDLIYGDKPFKKYLAIAFTQPLSFQLAISNQRVNCLQAELFKPFRSIYDQKDKKQVVNEFPQLFERILTFEHEDKTSFIMIYKQNKLMHSKKILSPQNTIFEFHLTNRIEQNLTFTDVNPTHALLEAIKSIVTNFSSQSVNDKKRENPIKKEEMMNGLQENGYREHPTKALKKNEQEKEEKQMNGQ